MRDFLEGQLLPELLRESGRQGQGSTIGFAYTIEDATFPGLATRVPACVRELLLFDLTDPFLALLARDALQKCVADTSPKFCSPTHEYVFHLPPAEQTRAQDARIHK